MTPVLTGLIGAVTAYLLVTLAERAQRAGLARSDGWTVLTPGWFIKFAILLCAGLAALIAWFFATGGSTRADASTQNLYAAGMLAVFSAGAVYVAWAAYARTIAWRDAELRVRKAFAGEVAHRLSDVTAAERIDARSEYRLTFRDGSNLTVSVYLYGASELIDRLPPGIVREKREDWS
jgi:hypothetical protein